MAELKEIFEMVTNKTEPNVDAWREQEQRERRRSTSRRMAAFAVAAAVLLVVIVAGAALSARSDTTQPAATNTAPPALTGTTSLIAIEVATGTTTNAIGNVSAFGAAVSPDGERIAFLRSVLGKPEIFMGDLAGTRANQMTGLPGQPGCACGAFDPSWSPDGSMIAFSGTDDAGNRGIYTLDIASGRIRAVTRWGGDSFEMTPAWSPDGSRIAFAAGPWDGEPAGSGMIYTIPAAGGKATLIARAPGAAEPSWGGDPHTLIYTARANGQTQVVETATSGANVRVLTNGAAPALSPDGTSLAFTNGADVQVWNLSTGEVHTLGIGGDPTWSPDGSTIYAWRAA